MSAQTSSKKKNTDLQEQVQKSFTHIVNDFILANLKLIGIVAVVIIAIVAGVLGWQSHARTLAEKAVTIEAEAFKLLEDVSGTAASEEETEHTWKDVQALYQKILDEYPGTKSAERALFLSGSLYYTHAQYADAQRQFNAYISKYPEGQLRNQAEESLGYVYEQQGDYQQALVTFKQAESNAPASRKASVLLAIGRNYENLNQPESAIEIYQQLLDANTSADWKEMARERLDILQPAAAVNEEDSTAVETPAEEPEILEEQGEE